jgi:multiple sugar transport system substrate-binding protein
VFGRRCADPAIRETRKFAGALGGEELKSVDPRYLVCAKMMSEGRTPFSVKYNELFNDQNGPWLAMFQEAVFGSGVDGAVKSGQDKFTAILNSK